MHTAHTTRNPDCENVKALKVFQVLDSFVLANVCESKYSRYCLGHVVYIPKAADEIYYDDQKIIINKNECVIYTGTFRYETREGFKTVPVAKIANSQVTNEK